MNTLLFLMVLVLGIVNGFLVVWWATLFNDYRNGFIGKYGGRYERIASLSIQGVLPVLFVIVFLVMSVGLSYVITNAYFAWMVFS